MKVLEVNFTIFFLFRINNSRWNIKETFSLFISPSTFLRPNCRPIEKQRGNLHLLIPNLQSTFSPYTKSGYNFRRSSPRHSSTWNDNNPPFLMSPLDFGLVFRAPGTWEIQSVAASSSPFCLPPPHSVGVLQWGNRRSGEQGRWRRRVCRWLNLLRKWLVWSSTGETHAFRQGRRRDDSGRLPVLLLPARQSDPTRSSLIHKLGNWGCHK